MTAPPCTRLLTVHQLARLLGRSPRTVRAWVRAGDLPGTRRVADGYRIPVTALGPLLRAQRHIACEPGTPPDTDEFPNGYDGFVPTEDPMPDLSTYLSLSQAAARVGRSTRTIRRWVQQGELPGALRIKQRILVPPADLDGLYQPAHSP